MIYKKLSIALAILLGLASVAPAFAQTGVGAGASVNANAGAGAASLNASTSVRFTAAEDKAKDRGGKEIDRRISALTDLNIRIQAMQRVSADFKSSIATALQNQTTALGNLKAKIQADSDSATLKTDIDTITVSYRVFALVMPQGRIAAAADRIVTIVTMMGTLGSKLQVRITAAGQAGADVTALNAALTDMGSKLADAQTQAQAAVNVSATLAPDNGDKTIMASNTAALKQARADIALAMKDLQDARKDVTTIVNGLKNAKIQSSTSASSTTTVTP